MEKTHSSWVGAIALTAMLIGCTDEKYFYHPPSSSTSAPASAEPTVPPTISAAGPSPLTETIAVSFDPSGLIFSASVNKLYVFAVWPTDMVLVVSLSAPTQPLKRLDTAIGALPHSIVINEKLRLGYALTITGSIKVFSTDSDTLVSTSREPSCHANLLAINQATGMVYGGGLSDKGVCLVQFDSDGRIVRENVLSDAGTKNMTVQRLAVDPVTGDVLYTSPSAVGRADQMLTEKWRTLIDGPGEAHDLGFEPKTNTVYVSVGNIPVTSPARIVIFDGGTGGQRGEFGGPGWTSQFAATGDGRLFVAFHGSKDLYLLSDGTSTLTKFASLDDIVGSSPDLTVDTAGRRLFVVPRFDVRKIFVYQY
ncbi:YncE family protein [Mycobacterium sp.]|uniref:YncE family protein n=1 Tax=Mycobacterium sp. TaxID=1785 RepID=UPI003F99DAFC